MHKTHLPAHVKYDLHQLSQ